MKKKKKTYIGTVIASQQLVYQAKAAMTPNPEMLLASPSVTPPAAGWHPDKKDLSVSCADSSLGLFPD